MQSKCTDPPLFALSNFDNDRAALFSGARCTTGKQEIRRSIKTANYRDALEKSRFDDAKLVRKWDRMRQCRAEFIAARHALLESFVLASCRAPGRYGVVSETL